MWCIPELTDEFIERMMDILEIYERPYNPKIPVICFDEKSIQLLAHTRRPVPVKQGAPERYDSEYRRKGTTNIFVAVEPKAGKHHTIIRKRRTHKDYSLFLKLIAKKYNNVERIIFIQDNLNTHTENSLMKAFGKEKAKKIMKKIEFHYTPKHGSWLNMAEIEISVLETECLNKRRFKDRCTLHREVTAWKKRRNDKKAKINWRFSREKAKDKFKLST